MRNQRRLKTKIDNLQQQWDLLTEKLRRLNNQKILESRMEDKLRLENQIIEVETEHNRVEQELKALEDLLSEGDSDTNEVVGRNDDQSRSNDKGRILWINDEPKEIESYKDALIAEGYSVTNVTTVKEANLHLDRYRYDLLILDVMIPTWTDQEDEEYPPDITNRGRTLGLQFYLKNKDKLRNKRTQVLVITKLEESRDGFIQAGLPKEQFCTAFSVRRVKVFMDKVNTMLSRARWSREVAERVLLQLSSNDEKEIHAACLTFTTLSPLTEPLYSKVHDEVQELTQHDNPRIRQLAISTLNFINHSETRLIGEKTMQPKILQVVLASPGDVQPERNVLPGVIEELNRGVGAILNVDLKLYRWETDAYPGFHAEGPQGLIDPILRIDNCDVLIGIFWHRFGTPTKDAGSGTEHEFRTAYEAWEQNKRPQIMVYFKKAAYSPSSPEELDQWRKVLEFQKTFPKEGLWWPFKTTNKFRDLVRQHLSGWLLNNFKS